MYAADEVPEEIQDPKNSATSALRVDHSDVYFENERLSDMLHMDLNQLQTNKHKQWMNRDSEINEIRRTLKDYRTIQKTQTDLKLDKTGGRYRPQTSSAYLCRRANPKQSAMTKDIPSIEIAENNSSDSDGGSIVDDDPFRNPRAKLVPSSKALSKHPSMESTNIINVTSSSKDRAQPFITQHQKRPRTSQSFTRFHNKNTNWRVGSAVITGTTLDNTDARNSNLDDGSGGANLTDDTDERRFNLICEKANSTLSRRQLIEMTNVDRLLNGQKRPTRREALLQANRLHMQELGDRVKMFIESLEKVTKKEEEVTFSKSLKVPET